MDSYNKMSSKTESIKSLLMTAWSERWTAVQWGINIKTILPRGVTGDVYNLSDYIVQQALISTGPNQLILTYLQHSLSAQLISYGATLESISKYEEFEKPHCVLSLLQLVNSWLPRLTCRGKPEDCLNFCSDLMKVTRWVLRHVNNALNKIESKVCGDVYENIVEEAATLLKGFLSTEFLYYCLHIGILEDKDCYQEIVKECHRIDNFLSSNLGAKYSDNFSKSVRSLTDMSLNYREIVKENPEPLAHILQPMLTFEALFNPAGDIQILVKQLLTLQQLKGWSIPELFCESLRVCLMGLSNATAKREEQLWSAITFIKLPLIIQYITSVQKGDGYSSPEDSPSSDVYTAISKLLDYLPLLDVGDTKCGCNFIECLLNELYTKTGLISDSQAKELLTRRQRETQRVSVEVGGQTPGNATLIILRAEPTLNSILKTLLDLTDSNKKPVSTEALLGVLCHVVKSFDLILTAAAATGKLQEFASKLIRLNSAARLGMGEDSTQTLLFDVSFLILMHKVLIYGQDVVLSEGSGESFFEKWLQMNFSRSGNPRPPDQITQECDPKRVEVLLSQLSGPDSELQNLSSYMKWDDICIVVPAVLQEILIAWEAGVLELNDVKRMLHKLRKRICCVSVCAAVWLYSFVQVLSHDSLQKPSLIIQELITPVENISEQKFHIERSSLMVRIIKRLWSNVSSQGVPIIPNTDESDTIDAALCSSKPLKELFETAWESVATQGWVDGKAAMMLEKLFKVGGTQWFVNSLVKVILTCEFRAELFRMAELLISIFHIDIQQCTLVLIHHTIPHYFFHQDSLKLLSDPQSSCLAYLTVCCCYAALLHRQVRRGPMKRLWDPDVEDIMDPLEGAPPAKVRLMTSWAEGEDSTIWSLELDSGRSSPVMSPPPVSSSDPLIKAVMGLWKLFLYALMEGDVSQRTQFITHFVNMAVKCGKDKSRVLLQFMPPALISYLIKLMSYPDELDMLTIVHLYDSQSTTGRKAISRMLCLKRNMQLSSADQGLH